MLCKEKHLQEDQIYPVESLFRLKPLQGAS